MSLNQLVEGYEVGRPVLPRYPAAILGTFPSIYQLLPRPRHGGYVYDNDPSTAIENIYDPSIWKKYGWGLAAQDRDTNKKLAAILPEESPEARRAIALDAQARMLSRAKAFHGGAGSSSEPT